MLKNSNKGVLGIEKNFLGKLSNGDLGLGRTYWLYGVFAGFVVNFTMSQMVSFGWLVTILFIYTVYQRLVIMGVWRAADKYTGLKFWAVLAKIAITLGAFTLALSWIEVIRYLLNT